jgi:hypothetical protein
MALLVERDKKQERLGLRFMVADRQGLIEKVVGAIYQYVSARYQELRFGAAVESAFEVVRAEVDGAIAGLVPSALPMLSAAFENAASDQPEHWANAASTCRRLLKLAADELRPAGDDLTLPGGKTVKMGADNYVNRLATWISEQTSSETGEAMLKADLEFLGARLDAADGAGQKGAHAAAVTREEASRYITGTYLLLGDILRLRSEPPGHLGPEEAAVA